MKTKVKVLLIKLFTYILSIGGMIAIVILQYFSKERNDMPIWIKVIIPSLLAVLIAFLVYYKKIKDVINRKLTAIETAKELGKAGKTNSVIANLLESLGIIIPLALIGAIFIIGGKYLKTTGIVLFELLAMYLIILIGNTICDFLKKQECKKKEAEDTEEFAKKVASKLENLPKKYE